MKKNLHKQKKPKKNPFELSQNSSGKKSNIIKREKEFQNNSEKQKEIIELETGRQRRNKAFFQSAQKSGSTSANAPEEFFYSPNKNTNNANPQNKQKTNSFKILENIHNLGKYLKFLDHPIHVSEANRSKFTRIQQALKNQSELDLDLFKEFMDLVYRELANQQSTLIEAEQKRGHAASESNSLFSPKIACLFKLKRNQIHQQEPNSSHSRCKSSTEIMIRVFSEKKKGR